MTINYLESIKKYKGAMMGFCALWIFFYHFAISHDVDINTITSYGSNVIGDTFPYNIFEMIIKAGALGVDIFFLLSGMGLVFSLEKHGVKEFYKNRIIRVVPALVAVCAIITLEREGNFTYFSQLVTFQYFFKVCIIYFSWFGYAIILVYLLFPVVYKLFNKSLSNILLPILVALIIPNIPLGERTDWLMLLNRVPILFLGIYYGMNLSHKPENTLNKSMINFTINPKRFLLISVITLIYGYMFVKERCYGMPFDGFVDITYFFYMPLPWLLSMMLVYIFELIKPKKFLQFVGRYSYEIFLFSMVFEFYGWFVKNLGKIGGFIGYFLIVLAVSVFCRESVLYLTKKRNLTR